VLCRRNTHISGKSTVTPSHPQRTRPMMISYRSAISRLCKISTTKAVCMGLGVRGLSWNSSRASQHQLDLHLWTTMTLTKWRYGWMRASLRPPKMLVRKGCVKKLRRKLHRSWPTNAQDIWLRKRPLLRKSYKTTKKEPIERGPHHPLANGNVVHGTPWL